MDDVLQLHGYWRSTASYRVRIALNLKGLAYTQVTHDLRKGEQRAADYLQLSPQGLVPALVVPGEAQALIQSPAILEWLEERWPMPPLLPAGARERAIVRSMAAVIGCDIHPVNNLRVLRQVRQLGGEQAAEPWIAQWIHAGFAALETLIARHGSGYAFGARPTLADCYLVPQVYAAERFHVPLDAYPSLMAAAAQARALDAFAAARPECQPDADA